MSLEQKVIAQELAWRFGEDIWCSYLEHYSGAVDVDGQLRDFSLRFNPASQNFTIREITIPRRGSPIDFGLAKTRATFVGEQLMNEALDLLSATNLPFNSRAYRC